MYNIVLQSRHTLSKKYTPSASYNQCFISNPQINKAIHQNLGSCLIETDLKFGDKHKGKVRDVYTLDNLMVMVTTDRLSAFDRVLTHIPFKGQVLNMTSAWWFEKTKHIVNNSLIHVPDPSVSVMKKLEVIPIEFIVRGYVSGSTKTSLWTQYKNGVRNYCGNYLPDGLKKNQKLEYNIVTPTTKGDVDEPISPKEIIKKNILKASEWDILSNIALELFAFGQQEAAKKGLILVDTKYEFGRDKLGNFYLIDELHTPDSSRFWILDTYESQIEKYLDPDSVDKDFIRYWFLDNSNPYKDVTLPNPPDNLIFELSKRYIYFYETLTGNTFLPKTPSENETRMQQIHNALSEQ